MPFLSHVVQCFIFQISLDSSNFTSHTTYISHLYWQNWCFLSLLAVRFSIKVKNEDGPWITSNIWSYSLHMQSKIPLLKTFFLHKWTESSITIQNKKRFSAAVNKNHFFWFHRYCQSKLDNGKWKKHSGRKWTR